MSGRRPGSDSWRAICDELDGLLAVADAELAAGRARERPWRQPVHTAYLPAHRADAGGLGRWGKEARAALDEHAPGPAELADATGLAPEMARQVRPLLLAKLTAEPVEDLRIDFEDGYGAPGDDTEDAHARAAGRALAQLLRAPGGPAFAGVRCKSLEAASRRRAIRTVEAFLAALTEGGGPLPPGLVITLPKVTSAAQVRAMAMACERLDAQYGAFVPGAPPGLLFEVQVETARLVVGADGAAELARCARAGGDRLLGLHFGVYDYTAELGIAAPWQSLDHPAADHARAVLQVAAAGTGLRLSDGSCNVLPVGRREDVVAAWRLHARLVRRSLERGFYQGWDLHPWQLVSRYAATYAFFREHLPAAAARLRGYAERAAHAQEEPATARALADFLVRALDCGAASQDEVGGATGLSPRQLRAVRSAGLVPGSRT